MFSLTSIAMPLFEGKSKRTIGRPRYTVSLQFKRTWSLDIRLNSILRSVASSLGELWSLFSLAENRVNRCSILAHISDLDLERERKNL